MTSRSRILTVCSVLAVAACGGDAASPKFTGTITDSAGVAIVTNTDVGMWSASEVPAFTESVKIGSPTDSVYQFAAIVGMDLGADGSVYVLDQKLANIRAYDAAGKHVRTIGRLGSGPGELSAGSSALLVTAGDTMLVVDLGNRRLNRYASTGEVVATIPVQITDGLPLKLVELDDGHIVVQLRPLNPENPNSMASGDALVVRKPDGSTVDTIMTLPGGETMKLGGAMGMQLKIFAPEPMWTAAGRSAVYYGVNSEYSIRMYDSTGALKRVVRRSVEKVPVPEEIKLGITNLIREQARGGGASPEMIDNYIKQAVTFGEHLPAIGNLLMGPNATLWVQRALSAADIAEMKGAFDPNAFGSRDWDVYDSEGRLLGLVKMPDKFTPVRWVGDKLVGVWRDESDVQHASVLSATAIRAGGN